MKDVKEGDFENLVAMMGHLGTVRDKMNQYDNMFDPIKKKVELLKSYGQEVPDDVFERLQVLFFMIINILITQKNILFIFKN